MSALPAAKRDALRFRIWQFAAPREWDVTVKEIAEALGERLQRINMVLLYAGWTNRIRAERAPRGSDGDYRAGGSARIVERFIVADILAGRVGMEGGA